MATQDDRLPQADHHAAAASPGRNVRSHFLLSVGAIPCASPPTSPSFSLSLSFVSTSSPTSSISAEIHNIFRVVWSGRWAVVTPFALLDALWKFVPRFRNYQQQVGHAIPVTFVSYTRPRPAFIVAHHHHHQDAQEFLVYLLDKLHDELTSLNGTLLSHSVCSSRQEQSGNSAGIGWNSLPTGGREVVASPSGQKRQGESIISKTFNGELLSQVTCSACGNVSSRREPYLGTLATAPAPAPATHRPKWQLISSFLSIFLHCLDTRPFAGHTHPARGWFALHPWQQEDQRAVVQPLRYIIRFFFFNAHVPSALAMRLTRRLHHFLLEHLKRNRLPRQFYVAREADRLLL